MKKILISVIICIILIITIMFFNNKKIKEIIYDNKKEYTLNINFDEEQKKVDKQMEKYALDKKITFDNPKVVIDPYNNSPLTALLIFYTNNSTKIKLYINDEFKTTMEKSNSHVIPIYGLREDYNNKVVIEDELSNKNTIFIKTEKTSINEYYDYTTKNTTEKDLFVNSPNHKLVIDKNGYISWFLNSNFLGIDITEDKKIYLASKYHTIIESDFLGRVYKKYFVGLIHYPHKIEKLKNGNIMLNDDDNFIKIIDYKTSKIIYELNVMDIIKKIDEDFSVEYNNLYVNHFQYDEEKNTILLSLRAVDCIINYDISNNKIIWMFTNNKKFSNKFDKYKLTLTKGGYFDGQHTPYLIGNELYVFNNNVYHTNNNDYTNNQPSRALIYEINDKKIKEIYRYENKYLSGWYGNFYKYDDTFLINYGNIINGNNGYYSKVIELDKNDNIITELTTKEDGIIVYNAFRDSFYNEITQNYEININYESLVTNDEEIRKKYIKYEMSYYKRNLDFIKDIRNSIIDETLVEENDSKISINLPHGFEIILIDNKFNYYKFNITNDYPFEDISTIYYNMIFNNIKGKYAMYIKYDGKYYNPKVILNIK